MPALTLEPQLGKESEENSIPGGGAAWGKAWRQELGVEISVTDAEREGGMERRAEACSQGAGQRILGSVLRH